MKVLSQNIQVYIKGKPYPLDKTHSYVFYDSDWYELYDDQSGDFYIFYNKQSLYLDDLPK